MRVSDYELFAVPPRWTFLRLTTTDGTVGWGEPVLEGRARTVRTAVEELLEDFVIGEDPARIERHWQRCYRGGHYRGGPVLMSAIAGIDQALWDIKGRQLGVPVYQLLGGRVRDRIRLSQWVGGEQPDAVAEAAERAVADGYSTVKLVISARSHRRDGDELVRTARERVGAVRAAVGDSVGVAVDCRGRTSRANVRRLASALEPYDPLFLEEPVLPEQSGSLPDIARNVDVPLATGQRLYSRWQFTDLLEREAIGFAQPDVSHAGGISEVKRIAGMAEAHDVSIMPKCTVGPIGFAACLQIDFCTPNATLQEESIEVHGPDSNDALGYLADPSVFAYEDGYLEAPDGPGLGVKLDEDVVRDRAGTHVRWRTPTWHDEDGSISEW